MRILFLFASLLLAQEETPVETIEQPMVTNVFYDIDLIQALRDISGQVKIPIITDGTVQGIITAELDNVPLDEALARILYPLGFTFKKMNGYYLVGSAKAENPAFSLLTETELIRPNYLKVASAARLLSTFYRQYITIDEPTNTIAITAPPEIIKKLKDDLAKIDNPPRQILIEALVTEISSDALRSLGIDWSGKGIRHEGRDTLFSILADLAKIADTTFGLVFRVISKSLGGLAYYFAPSIQALVQEGKATIRANPKIVTTDAYPANILVGRELFYQIVSGPAQFPYYRLEVIKIGTSLNITPYIANNGEITLEVAPEVSDVTGQGIADLPIISKRSVKTQIRVKDGERIVIGGLLAKNERIIKRKIPLLGDIPILGLLFQTTRRVVEENEVVVFITPHIL